MNYISPKKMSIPMFDKITINFVPTFYHLALVKVALPLFYKYGSDELNIAMTTIQLKKQLGFSECIQEERVLEYSRVEEELLHIPAHLRRRVVEAVNAIECEVDRWRKEHYFLRLQEENTKCREEDVVYWRSDGTINRIKTAEELVRNESIKICVRFQIACKYCFTDSIKTLWSKIVASGQSELYLTDDSIESFWIQWIQTGSPADWTSVILRQSWPPVRCSSFFSSLHPDVRKEALTVIDLSSLDLDDFTLCVSAMTHEEQKKMLKMDVVRFLSVFLQWPLQDFFMRA